MSTMTWNPMTHEDYDTLKGFDVYTFDNEKLGTIKDVFHPQAEMPAARDRHYFRVAPGALTKLFKDTEELFLPERLIGEVKPNEDKVVLAIPKERIEEQDWSRPRELESYRRS